MTPKKVQVYLFEDVPLEVIVINHKGKILRTDMLKWDGIGLSFLSSGLLPIPDEWKGGERS